MLTTSSVELGSKLGYEICFGEYSVKKSGLHILVGIHTSGKSSVGRKLSQRGFSFFPEIALDQISNAGLNMLPWQGNCRFDDLVIRTELNRDEVLRAEVGPYFVETWHVGNLAHARIRNRETAAKYEAEITRRVHEFEPLVYFLDMPPEFVSMRTKYLNSTRDHAAAIVFYTKIRAELLNVFDLLNLKPTTIDAAQDVVSITNQILRYRE